MFNINDIFNAAQGGQGVNNLAQQFGLTAQQAQAAIQAMAPAFTQGLQQQAATPNGLGAILAAMAANPLNQQSFQNPQVAQSPDLFQQGSALLNQIFGTQQNTSQVAQQAAASAGVNPQVLQQMMPVMASMLMGGMFQAMQMQGLGPVMTQLATAATQPGGLGALFGQNANPQGANPMALFSTFFAGLAGGAPPQPQAPKDQTQAMQSGLEAFNKMMQGSMEMHQAQLDGFQALLNQFTPKK